MRLRRTALIVVTAALCATATVAQGRNSRGKPVKQRPSNANAVQAVSLIKKLDTAVSLGISPLQYESLVVEVVPQVQEALAKVPESELKTELSLSLSGFIDLHKIHQIMSGPMTNRFGIGDYLIEHYGVDSTAAKEFEILGAWRDLVLQNIFAVAHNNLVAAINNLAGRHSRPFQPSQSSQPQTVPAPSIKCNLDSTHAVQLRGLRLRMPLAEIQQRFPGATMRIYGREKDENPTMVLRPKKNGDSLLEGRVIRPYSDVTVFDISKFPDYEGVNEIILTFVNDVVASIEIAYDNRGLWTNVSDFIATISEKLSLPKAWVDNSLSCEGWSLSAEEYPAVARLKLIDLTLNNEVQRQRADKQRAQEGNDEKKRKVFKP